MTVRRAGCAPAATAEDVIINAATTARLVGAFIVGNPLVFWEAFENIHDYRCGREVRHR